VIHVLKAPAVGL